MSNIVSIVDGQTVTTSLAIAEGVGNPHSSVIRLIRDNKADIEEFGPLSFEIRPRSNGRHGGGNTEYAMLNEQQATLLMTYMRNNDVVRAFKKRLVKAFFQLAQNSRAQLPDFSDPVQAARAWADAQEKRNILALENKAKDERIEKLESFFHPGMTITAFGKMLNGVNCAQLSNYCFEKLGWLYNESRSGNNKRWRVACKARDKFLTETNRPIGAHGGETFIKHEPKLLSDGAKKLYDLYLEGELPMKKTWNGEFVHVKFDKAA
jgi:phage regulator Rha-like protein